MSEQTIVERFAEFGQEVDSTRIRVEDRRDAGLHLLDTLGCILSAARLPMAQYLRSIAPVNGQGHGEGYSVLGLGATPSLGDAALINGTLATGFELDSIGVYSHPGPCVVPAAIAAAEYARKHADRVTSGREFLTAVMVGYETEVRIADWIGFAPERDLGWHTPAFHGAIGGAAAAARVLGLPVQAAAHALTLGADMAGGGLIHERNDAKRIHTGRAAETGVRCAILASVGVEGDLSVLEDPRWGYYRALRYGSEPTNAFEDPNTATLTDGLGERFISFPRVAIKYYPFVGAGQTIIDNINAIKRESALPVEEVESIRVGVSSFMFDHGPMLLPARSLATANFSFPNAAAMAIGYDLRPLTEAGASADAFLDGFAEPSIAALQDRVTCYLSDELDGENQYTFDTVVSVRLRDGREFTRRTRYGERARREGGLGSIALAELSPEGIVNKFMNLTREVLSEAAAHRAVDLVTNLDDVADVSAVIEPLAYPPLRASR